MKTTSRTSESVLATHLLAATRLTALLLVAWVPTAWPDAPGPRIELGPGAAEPSGAQTAERPLRRLPPLDLAVPVLDPGLPANQQAWEKRGIWPELRRAEAVRSAHMIAEAIRARGLFDRVIVTPDSAASADLYLLGEITRSNGEDLRIRFRLLDATGRNWLADRTVRHRVPEGWHENNVHRRVDPFADLYTEIATLVEQRALVEAGRHAAAEKRNQSRIARGRSPRLSDVEKLALTRDLVLARYFAPDIYADTLRESNGRLRLRYLPAMDTEEWIRIQTVQARDRDFSQRLSGGYADFTGRMQQSYALWQRDSYPIARQQRLLKERSTAQAILGVLAAAATVAAAADKDVGTLPTVAAGAASAALLYSSFRTNRQRRAEVAELNELGRSLQTELAPAVVELEQGTVTLRGTATEQFTQWRELLRAMYANQTDDLTAVAVVGASP